MHFGHIYPISSSPNQLLNTPTPSHSTLGFFFLLYSLSRVCAAQLVWGLGYGLVVAIKFVYILDSNLRTKVSEAF